MKTADLLFVGIKGSVIAIERATGKEVWAMHLSGSGFVNVVVHENTVLATTFGELFAMDPLTGNRLWHNPLTGYGRGLITLAAEGLGNTGATAALAAKHQEDEQAAAASAAASV